MRSWQDRWPEKAAEDREHWASRGFKEVTTSAGEVTFEGPITSSVSGANGRPDTREYVVRVRYPVGYPNDHPDVEFVDPEIPESRHMLYGIPCLFEPRAWTTTVPASAIERRIEVWLRGHRTDEWDTQTPAYELPQYYVPVDPRVLLPGAWADTIDGATYGTFRLQRFFFEDVAVVRSLNKQDVGADMVDDLAFRARDLLNGQWYRLEAEPQPVRNTATLEHVIAAGGHTWSAPPRAGENPRFVGLVFPDAAVGDLRFLLFRFAARKRLKPHLVKGWDLDMLPTFTVSRDEMFKRVGPVRDLSALDSARVAIFGVGAIGSHVASALTREGIGSLRLVDGDRMKPGNLVRHTLNLRHVGQLKAPAVAAEMLRVNPDSEIESHTDKLHDPDAIEMRFADCDVVVSAIGDEIDERLLSEVAVTGDHPAPLLIVRTLHAGAALRIMLIRRGRDACLTCLGFHREDEHPDWLEVPDDDLADIRDEGCASPSRPGSGLASEQAALLAARRVLALIEGDDSDDNHWVSVLTPVTNTTDPRLTTPQDHTMSLPVHPDCPWCNP